MGLPFRLLLGVAVAGLVLLLGFPLASVVVRVPPAELLSRMSDPALLEALRLSLVSSAAATAVVVALGLPVAYLLATRVFPGKRLMEVLIELPMVLPPTVAGLALLLAFGRNGLAGRSLALLGVSIPFSTLAVVLAQAFIAAPFFISAARAGLSEVDPRYLDAAATLRASPARTLVRVMLPLALPSMLAGAAMSWARALGEFGATITFAGNLPGVTQTMPLAVYVALQRDVDAAVAMSVVLLALAVGVLLSVRVAPSWLGWLDRAHARRR
jgi:molybdate transport system permease protein